MNQGTLFLISLVLGSALGYLALLSGFWYALIVAGFVVGLLHEKFVNAFLSLFAAGVLSTLFVLLPLFNDGLLKIMDVTGALVGVNGAALLAIAFLVSGLMSGAGALIGASLRSIRASPTPKEASRVKG